MSIFILSMFDFYVTPSAYAFSIYTLTIGDMSGAGAISYATTTQLYVINRGSGVINTINPSTRAVNSYSLPSLGVGQSYGLGIYCGTNTCFTSIDQGSGSDAIREFNPATGATIFTYTVGSSGTDIVITGFQLVSTSINTVRNGWYVAQCSGGDQVIFTVTGIVLGTCGGTAFGTSAISGILQQGTQVAVTTQSASNAFRLWSISTLTQTCVVNVNLGTGGSLAGYNGNWYVVKDTNTINKYDSSCSLGTGITGTGISSQIFGLSAFSGQGVMVVEGTTSLSFMNLTSNNISTLAYSVNTNKTAITTNVRNTGLIMGTTVNQVALTIDITGASDPAILIQIAAIPDNSTSNPNIVNGVDCADPLKAQTLLCRLSSNAGALTASAVSIEQSGNNIACQIRIISCTQGSDGNFTPDNPDMKTNGIGYIFTFVLLGVFVGLLWVAGRGDLTSIPTFVWFIGTIAVLAASVTLQWVNPTFLVIGVITVAAFAVAKARNVFGGGLLNEVG